MATKKLVAHGFEVIPLGIREGQIDGLPIITKWPDSIQNLGVVTLYLGPKNQLEWYDYVISLRPKKVIFNPGTENPEFEELLGKHNIIFERACTLVLLSLNQFDANM